MKTKNQLTTLLTLLLLCSLPALASQDNPRAFFGVELYETPEILIKHLKLEPNQGVVVRNVYIDGPAYNAGLDRDDIILNLNKENITNLNDFIHNLQNAGTKTEIKMEVMHLGKRREIKLTLAESPAQLLPNKWKYPNENTGMQITRPGKMFRLSPDQRNWIPMPNKPNSAMDNMNIKEFLTQRYVFQHNQDGKNFTVTIKGDPNDQTSTITIKDENNIHTATIGEVEKLPKEYIESAKDYIQQAKTLAVDNQFHFENNFNIPHMNMPDIDFPNFDQMQEKFQPFFDKFNEKGSLKMDEMNESMDKLRDQIRKMEEKMEQLLNNPKEQNKPDIKEMSDAPEHKA